MTICKNIFFSFFALFLVLVAESSLAEEPLPIDAFAMRPAIQRVSVSPDGKHLGLLRGRSFNGDYILEIFDTRDLKKTPIRIGSKVMELTAFNWLNNKRVLISVRQKVKRGNNKWRYRRYIINADGTGDWQMLPNDGRAQLMSVLRNSPNEILLSIYPMGSKRGMSNKN